MTVSQLDLPCDTSYNSFSHDFTCVTDTFDVRYLHLTSHIPFWR